MTVQDGRVRRSAKGTELGSNQCFLLSKMATSIVTLFLIKGVELYQIRSNMATYITALEAELYSVNSTEEIWLSRMASL